MSEVETVVEKKKGKVLWIIGILALVVAVAYYTIFNANLIIQSVNGDELGVAAMLVFGLIIYFLPGAGFSLLSILFNTLSWNKQRKNKARLTTFIISLVIGVAYLAEYLVMYLF